MKNIYIHGRGEISTRLKEIIKEREKNINILDDVQQSDFVFLTSDENKNEKFLNANHELIGESVIIDFSSNFKNRGIGVYILDHLFNERGREKKHKIITLPACYASSVIIPIRFMEKNFLVRGSEISIVSVGGKSTLGKNKNLQSGNLRLSSSKSEDYHLNEIKNHTYNFENIYFKLLVGDLKEGILSIINIKCPESNLKYDLEVTLDLKKEEFLVKTMQSVSMENISNNNEEVSKFWVRYNAGNESYDIYSYVNNLNLPIELALKYIEHSCE